MPALNVVPFNPSNKYGISDDYLTLCFNIRDRVSHARRNKRGRIFSATDIPDMLHRAESERPNTITRARLSSWLNVSVTDIKRYYELREGGELVDGQKVTQL